MAEKPPPLAVNTPPTEKDPDEIKDVLPLQKNEEALSMLKEPPERNAPEMVFQVEEETTIMALAETEAKELKFTVLPVTENVLNFHKKLLGEFNVDEDNTRPAKHALPAALPIVLAEDDTVITVADTVRYFTDPKAPFQ